MGLVESRKKNNSCAQTLPHEITCVEKRWDDTPNRKRMRAVVTDAGDIVVEEDEPSSKRRAETTAEPASGDDADDGMRRVHELARMLAQLEMLRHAMRS